MAAQTASCDRCGASIAFEELVPWLHCGHCGHHQRLDPQRMAQLQHYRHQVAQDVSVAGGDRAQAAMLDAQRKQATSGAQYVLAFGLAIGLPVVVIVGGLVLMMSGAVSDEYKGALGGLATLASLIGILLYVIVYALRVRGKGEASVEIGRIEIACPHCGAGHEYRHGQALDRCAYCHAALMPSTTVIQVGLDAARTQRRRAEMDRWRSERSLVVGYQNMGLSSEAVLMIAFLPMIGMMGVTAIGMSFQMIVGTEPYSHGIFALWAMVIAATGGLVAVQRWMAKRKKALGEASRALAHQIAGRPLRSLDHFVSWLNQFWAAEYNQRKLQTAGLYGGAEGTVDGYAAMVECSASSDRHRPKRLQVFLAAHVPGVSDGGAVPPVLPHAAEEQQRWLLQQGYEPRITAAGLLLEAREVVVERVSKDLGSLAQVAPILHHAALLLKGLGAVPAAAIE